MAVEKVEVSGHWAKVRYRSDTSRKVYLIDAHWERTPGAWIALVCRCKGFINRASCRHLGEVTAHMRGTPAPGDDTGVALKKDTWVRCGICSGVEFMLKPMGEGTPDLICAKCGRYYTWE